MGNGLVIADSGPIFSLALIDKLDILNVLFDSVKIPNAVWIEITSDTAKPDFQKIFDFFKEKTCQITGFNELTFIMDYGESESVVLYHELHADFLLIDDKKARNIAENLGVNCIGIIGLLSKAKAVGLIENLKPLFETFLSNKRYYSVDLLNTVLKLNGEESLTFSGTLQKP